MSNIVAIVGRPNVGKSTLFNRLVGARKAIEDEQSGVTRDRHYGYCEWNGKKFSVIDTGGYVKGSEDIYETQIRRQVELAIDEASVIIFVVDIETGITDLDTSVANILRKSGKKILLMANKVDNPMRQADAAEFYRIGLGEPFCVAAINGSGTGELLDAVTALLPEETVAENTGIPRFAIVGQPNVGKSSLLNCLLGDERTIVTPLAGTTRDSIDTHYKKFGHEFILIDTAGIRRKAKVKDDVEFYSVLRAVRAIEEADVCMLLIDATAGIQAQDMSIFSMAKDNGKGIVLVVNKWDLMEKNTSTAKEYEQTVRQKIQPFKDVPIVFASVLEKQRVMKVIETAIKVQENRKQKISTSKLNKIMLPLIEITPPPSNKGRSISINYVTQLPTHYPQFAFFCNQPQYVSESYGRFLENKLRENFDFTGVPVKVYFRAKN
ncbi:MAG TPA: ribosome biogenesis GTPase Der [Bacteroidia bacterium]|nr:ribosome biogenesis GTPase Der [Bacteroidia bacterium]